MKLTKAEVESWWSGLNLEDKKVAMDKEIERQIAEAEESLRKKPLTKDELKIMKKFARRYR